MRVKVGNRWYQAEHMQPIMVELTYEDKRSIASMPNDQSRYAQFSKSDLTSDEYRIGWVQDKENG